MCDDALTYTHFVSFGLSRTHSHSLNHTITLTVTSHAHPHPHMCTQAVIPGGVSVPMLTAEMCEDALMDFDGLRVYKSALGTGSMTVLDKSQDPIAVVARIASFFK